MNMNATDKMVMAINKVLGKDTVAVDHENSDIIVNGEEGYTICCDDDDEVYNTLSAMLQGMMLMREVEIERSAV